MRWEDLGAILKTLREERQRFLPGAALTQKAMAQRVRLRLESSHISYELRDVLRTIQDFEQGNIRHLTERRRHVLIALMEELHLTPMERAEILRLANNMDEGAAGIKLPSLANAVARMKDILQYIRLPSYVIDSFGYLLLVNRAVVGLYDAEKMMDLYRRMRVQLPPHVSPVNLDDVRLLPHLVYFVLSDETGFPHLFLDDETCDRVLTLNVQFFRRISIPHRHTDRWKRLLRWFTDTCGQENVIKRFQKYWIMAATRPELDGNVAWGYDLRLPHLRREGEEEPVVRFTVVGALEPTRAGNIGLFTDIPQDEKTVALFERAYRQAEGLGVPDVLDLSRYVNLIR